LGLYGYVFDSPYRSELPYMKGSKTDYYI